MPQESFHVVELERKLKQDNSGKARDDIMHKLGEYRTQLKDLSGSGLAPEAFQAIKKLQRAVDQAEVIVHGYWLAMHPN
ncbi:MAG: hypothetical protein B7X06_02695 [Verrucomicrobia bacterium 21-51-4]|nr:MAG: hypothetical protein B7X06_02695 [Verrucomicrobia bacterium 21-51-4]HQU09276.1 EscE/YscE/SsaE family type III secretion system needle protein co-chaperone [Opitutales bacterium]